MNNKRGKVLAASVIALLIVFLFAAGLIRENAHEAAVPVIGTVYFDGEFDGGVTAKAAGGGEVTVSNQTRPQLNTVTNEVRDTPAGASPLNINTASKEELMELPGVGEVTADKIIEYREMSPFKTPEELIEVKGIGEAKLEKILPFITV